MARVLICDDDEMVVDVAGSAVRYLRHEYRVAYTTAEAIRQYHEYKPDLLMINSQMPIKSGLRAVNELLETEENLRVIFMAGGGTAQYLRMDYLEEHGFTFLEKPFDLETLDKVLCKALGNYQAEPVRKLVEEHGQKNVFNIRYAFEQTPES